MIYWAKISASIAAHQLSRLIALGALSALWVPLSGFAQTTSTLSTAQQQNKQEAEIVEFLDRLTELQIPNLGRFFARWRQPINVYINLPQDPELQRQLTSQLYRLNDEVRGLPVLTVHSKFGGPEKANFIIESASAKDIEQKAAARGINIGTDQCALNINVETRGISAAQINHASLITRESQSRDTNMRCLLKLVMIGLGIGDPDGNSILLFNAAYNSNNKAAIRYDAGDITLLRYAYAARTAQSPKEMPLHVELAESFWGAPHMAQRALPRYQEVKSLLKNLYAKPEGRAQNFQKLTELLGKPSALAYLSFISMNTDKDFVFLAEWAANIDMTDLDLLLQQCSSCFFTLLADSIESAVGQGQQNDAKKLITAMVAAHKQDDPPVQRFLTLYYQSLLEWESPNSEKHLQEALDLVKMYCGVRSAIFLNFKGTMVTWYAQHDDLAKATAQMDDTEALYGSGILSPSNEGRQLMSRAEIYHKAGNQTKARENLAQARKRLENIGTDADLVRLESIEKNLAAD